MFRYTDFVYTTIAGSITLYKRCLSVICRCLDDNFNVRTTGGQIEGSQLLTPKQHQNFTGLRDSQVIMQRILGATSTLAGAAIVAGVSIEFFTYDGKSAACSMAASSYSALTFSLTLCVFSRCWKQSGNLRQVPRGSKGSGW